MADAKTKELLPCPFCGGSNLRLGHSIKAEMSWVACTDCGLEAPCETGEDDDHAIAYWNRRAAPQPAASDVPHDVVRALTIIEMCSFLPLVKHRLGELGLLKTMQAMEAAVTEVGYEVAQGKHNRDEPRATPAPSTSTEEALRAENARLRAALEWYADPKIYRCHPHGLAFDDRDKSYHALSALSR